MSNHVKDRTRVNTSKGLSREIKGTKSARTAGTISNKFGKMALTSSENARVDSIFKRIVNHIDLAQMHKNWRQRLGKNLKICAERIKQSKMKLKTLRSKM